MTDKARHTMTNINAASPANPVAVAVAEPGVAKPVPVLTVADLRVRFRGTGGPPAVADVSFRVFPGEVLALVGESGSGKSVTARAVLGLLPDTAEVTGSILLQGHQTMGGSDSTLQPLRGRGAAMVFQEPQTALNPVRTVGWQITEALRAHQRVSRTQARRRAIELLDLVGIPEPSTRVDSFAHQLSGGQKQRVVIALALANDPAVLIADEPTTALDVTVQAEILQLLRDLRKQLNTAILLITHNMGVVADSADRVLVMRRGRMVERGEVLSVFSNPFTDYTRDLLAAVPTLPVIIPHPYDQQAVAGTSRPVISLSGRRARTAPPPSPPRAAREGTPAAAMVFDRVEAQYPGRLGRRPFTALRDVSITVDRGETLGIVGESGSGKTTIARVASGRLPVISGRVTLDGVDLSAVSRQGLRAARATLGLIYQDPATSLDPLRTVGQSIAEPLTIHRAPGSPDPNARVAELLESVQLPKDYRHRRPSELSGGQRQRVALARALALEPALLIADEPTSALDVSVQATILDLLTDLQKALGFACVFISHDLAVVHDVADRVVVMRHGEVVEQGTSQQVLQQPTSDYTRRLVAAVPVPDPVVQRAKRPEEAAG